MSINLGYINKQLNKCIHTYINEVKWKSISHAEEFQVIYIAMSQ